MGSAAAALIAWGVGYRPQNETGDWTPLVAILAALLIARFVVRRPLTPVSGAFAVFCGALWAYAAQRWGHSVAAIGAVAVVLATSAAAGRMRPRPPPEAP